MRKKHTYYILSSVEWLSISFRRIKTNDCGSQYQLNETYPYINAHTFPVLVNEWIDEEQHFFSLTIRICVRLWIGVWKSLSSQLSMLWIFSSNQVLYDMRHANAEINNSVLSDANVCRTFSCKIYSKIGILGTMSIVLALIVLLYANSHHTKHDVIDATVF